MGRDLGFLARNLLIYNVYVAVHTATYITYLTFSNPLSVVSSMVALHNSLVRPFPFRHDISYPLNSEAAKQANSVSISDSDIAVNESARLVQR